METKTKITIDMLTEESVSIETKTFIEFESEQKEVKSNRKAYINSERGRKELENEQPENIVKAVFAVWEDGPSINENKNNDDEY